MKEELTNLSNKELIESLFSQIEEKLGYHIINKNYIKSYFVFEVEKYSICNFKIKEIQEFTFSVWNTDRFDKPYSNIDKDVKDTSELVFFTQYDINLDKFKPSRSGFVIGLEREILLEEDNTIKKEEWDLYDLESILNFMKKHKIKSAVYVTNQISYITDEKSSFECLREFISYWFYYFKYKFIDWVKYKKAIHIGKIFLKKINKIEYCKAFLVDKGEDVHPRIELIYYEEQDKVVGKDDILLDNLFRWLNKKFNYITIYCTKNKKDYARYFNGNIDDIIDFKE